MSTKLPETIERKAGRLLAAPTLLDGRLVCNRCGQIMRSKMMRDVFKSMTGESGDRIYEMQTLVGYYSPSGHNHDDNCWTREYACPIGHTMKIGKRRRCPACDWVGKESCECHDCLKVDEFPEPSNYALD